MKPATVSEWEALDIAAMLLTTEICRVANIPLRCPDTHYLTEKAAVIYRNFVKVLMRPCVVSITWKVEISTI
jgi:hypothetical protein